MNKNTRQFLTAAATVAVGLVIFNNVKALAGNTVVGKAISGGLVRRAG